MAPHEQVVYGIVQGGVEHDLRRESAQMVAASDCDGIAIGGSLGRDKAQMHEVVSWATAELEQHAPQRPRHLLGIGDIDDLIAGVALGIDTFDCALPTRLGRHGVALIPEPAVRWRLDLVKSGSKHSPEPILDGCPCPACAGGYSRAYLHYLLRAREMTGLRLITQHNLCVIGRLMAALRAAIDGGRLPELTAALHAGDATALQAGDAAALQAGAATYPPRPSQQSLLRVLVDQRLDLVVAALEVVRHHRAETHGARRRAVRDHDRDRHRRDQHQRQRQQRHEAP